MTAARLRTLRNRAAGRCQYLGHDMRWSSLNDQTTVGYGFCSKCFASVAIRSYAAMDGEMVGRAVEIKCSKARS